jgi:DNA (cytosine-5)-methyltransferase 1
MNWGKYEPAIRRWEAFLGRPAPAPTNPDGKDGSHRLAAEFVEWMMGLPVGWVTDPELGLKRNDQLKALGNGVVPQQAKYALQFLIDDEVLNKLGKK